MAAAETDKVLGDLINQLRSENNVHAQAQDDWATEELIILGNVNDHLEVIQDWTSKMFSSFQGLESSFKPSEAHTEFLKSISTSGEGILKVLGNILNLQLDDSAAAREAAREAARAAKGGGDEKGGVPDAKVEEAKAGGFFSKLGAAVMNPLKALGSGLKKIPPLMPARKPS